MRTKKKKKRRNWSMVIKLDISKNYNKLEWYFLECMMRQLGFDEFWIGRVITCITTVSYAVLTNGLSSQEINPTRGIRQDDPLSPYLYLICDEGLRSLLQEAEICSKIKGVRVAKNSPTINHIFFADHSIIFCGASLNKLK